MRSAFRAAAIFNYFSSKDDLFLELARRDNERLIQLWMEKGWEATLREVVEEDPDWIGVYLELSRKERTNPELSRLHRAQAEELAPALIEHVREEQARGDLRDGRAGREDRRLRQHRRERNRGAAGKRRTDPRRRHAPRVRAKRRRTAYDLSSSGYAFAYTRRTRSTSSTYARVSGNAMPLPSASHWSTFPWPAW